MKSPKLKYINIACVVVGFCVPLVPTVALIIEYAETETEYEVYRLMNITFLSGNPGFQYDRFPPTICRPSNRDISYYAMVLPINIIATVGILELVLIFWKIHKVCVIETHII